MSSTASRKLQAPLRDRQAGPLLASFWAAELADGIISVLIPVAVYAVTQDVSAVALVFLGRMLLGILMAHLGGWLADRYQRKYLLATNYLVRILCATTILVWQDHVLLFALLGILLGSLGAFDNPAAEAGIRSVFRHDLQSVAVMRNVGKTLSQMIGPALGGLLFGTVGVTGALWASIGLTVLAVLVITSVAPLPVGSPREKNLHLQKSNRQEKPPLIGAVIHGHPSQLISGWSCRRCRCSTPGARQHCARRRLWLRLGHLQSRRGDRQLVCRTHQMA